MALSHKVEDNLISPWVFAYVSYSRSLLMTIFFSVIISLLWNGCTLLKLYSFLSHILLRKKKSIVGLAGIRLVWKVNFLVPIFPSSSLHFHLP